MKKTSILGLLTLCCLSAQGAVHISPDNTGQVALVPLYSVANDLSTLLLIENNRDVPKAIKVHVREARGGRSEFYFNLYLNAQAAFSAALYLSQDEMLFYSPSDQCHMGQLTPVEPVVAAGEVPWDEFTGSIEVFEMGEIIDPNEQFFRGTHVDCDALNAAWDGNQSLWGQDPGAMLSAATGGIQVNTNIINVFNGFMIDVPTVYLDGFAPGDGVLHEAPLSVFPDLSSGDHTSLILHNGETITSDWPTGHQAITAVLSRSRIENDYVYDHGIGGQADFIFTFPTWRFHRNDTLHSPFIRDNTGGFTFPGDQSGWYLSYWRNGFGVYNGDQSAGGPGPVLIEWHSNTTVLNYFVYEFTLHTQPMLANAAQDHVMPLDTLHYGDEGKLAFVMGEDVHYKPISNGNHVYHGLPVIGFRMQFFANLNAQPGILANYAEAREHNFQRRIETVE